MSMGQWLCVPMIVGGIALWLWAGKHEGGTGALTASKP
jgi:phosphatidylglycerol---prolipoprotein diacylglyceryl transferase